MMMMGSRGRRSWKLRLSAGVALFATMVGPLRMAAYAVPLDAPRGKAAGSGKLPTDTPWALPVRLRAGRISVLDGSVDVSAVRRLFDGRAASGLSTGGRPARFRVDLDSPTYLDALAIYGKADGGLTVETDGPKGKNIVIQRASLATARDGWNRREFVSAPLATSVTIAFEPTRAEAMLRELELWGRPASAPPGDQSALFPDALYTGVPLGARSLPASPAEQTIALSTVSGPGVGGTFAIDVDAEPGDMDRAFLVYDLEGLPHFTAALRSINGQRSLGRFGVSRGAKGGLQVEEIDPAALRSGSNHVQFFPVDEHDPGSYRVRNLRLVYLPRAGTRLTDASARSWEALRDGREGTGWKAEPGKAEQRRDWSFTTVTQPWALDLRLPTKGVGTLVIGSASGGNTGEFVVKLDDLSAGWHRVPLDHLPPSSRLTFRLTAGKEATASISELAVEGSPLPADEAPRLAVTYPLSGECVNHRVHVRGFVTPAGADSLHADGARMSGAIAPDGSFGFELPEKDAAGRDLMVEAAYANGARARQAVSIGRCVDRPPVVIAGDGRPRQPVDDLGAPYGVIVKAGEATTLAFDGVRLEIPAGAVEKDVRITIRPLPTKDVAPLDAGMTNVTPSAQAFRFGPLGMLFKKSVQMTVPYDDHLIPAGFDQNDVRTFYFDEALHRWEQVGLVGQDERKMVAVSDHFTDFINATITTPEHPGPQSDNPTSLKDIKLADPSAGIAQIQAPVPNSEGTANLRFPIEVPAGRRGLQPDLDLAYSNEGGNGWLGIGWDLKPSAIEIDTRFGVPSYQGAEVYMFDGEMLTTDPSGSGLYRRRAESSFEIIQRNGSAATNYSWTVKDKNGTVFVFGSSPATRLTDPDPTRGYIFRWYLESETDVFGNRMTYSYAADPDPNQQFTQMYLSEIDYTSNVTTGQTASFQVKFNLDTGTRADAFSSARSGFLVMTRRLLKSIDVDMNNALVRRYNLTYQNGLFNRPLLSSVSMVGSDGTTALYNYTFGYHNPFPANGDITLRNYFSAPVLWGQLNDLSGSNMSLRTENGLSSSDMEMKGLNASIGINLEFFGFHISGGVAGGDDNRHMLPLDFNGDGLPDFVDDGNGINLNALPVTGFNPQRFTTLSSSAVSFFPPSGHTNRSGWNFGGGITVGNQVAGLGVDADYARTSSEDDRIITDIDGDGYPDIVQINAGVGGPTLQVYQNQAAQAFVGLPPKTDIGQAPGRAASVADWNQQQASGTFPVDPIIRWRAPFAAAGKVTITGPVVKKKMGGDGIHASLWVAQGPQPSSNLHKLWEADVADPTISCTPSTTGDPCSGTTPPAVSNIQGGDRIYAIVDPKTDTTSDVVDWNPTITYDEFTANPSAVEPYGAPVYQFAQSPDFRVVGLPWKSWQANADGDLRLDMALNKQPTSDDVTIQLLKLPLSGASGNVTVPGTVVWSQLVQAADGLTSVQQPIPSVHNGDKFVLEVVSDTQIDPARLGITSATLRYTTFSRVVGNNKPSVSGILDYLVDPSTGQPVSARIEGDTVTLPIDVVLRPVTPHFPPHETLPLATTKSFASPGGVLSIDGTVLNIARGAAPAVVLIQGVNKLFKKYPVPTGGSVQTQFQTPSTNPGEPIFFTILSQTADVQPGAIWSPTVNGQAANVNARYPDAQLHTQTSAADPDSWAGGYHGWYVGDFDGSLAFNESLFSLPKFFASHQGHDDFMFCIPQYQDGTGAPRQFFQCRGVGSYVQAGEISPSRSASGTGDDVQLRSVRAADTVDLNVSASVTVEVANASAGLALGETKSTLDFIDMNGDGYPDSVAGGGILYGDGLGGFSAVGPPLPFSDLRNVDSRSVRGSVGAGTGGGSSFLLNIDKATGKAGMVLSSQVGVGIDYAVASGSTDLVDINGDGLPDQVSQDPVSGATTVRLNLGYRFGPPTSWTNPAWSNPQVESFSLLNSAGNFLGNYVGAQSLSVSDTAANSASVSVEGVGAGDVQTTSRTLAQFLDVNGDGLPDEIMKESGTQNMRVKINMGTGFAAEDSWPLSGDWPDPQNPGANLSITPDPSFLYPTEFLYMQKGDGAGYSIEKGWQASLGFEVCFFICFGISGFETSQNGWSQMEFMDIDGDGKPDHVLKTDGNPNVYAKLSQIGNADMLETVTGSFGDTIELGYGRAGNNVNTSLGVDMPSNHWVLTSVRTGDGRGNHYTDTIDYHLPFHEAFAKIPLFSGFYDRKERENYGFGNLVITHGQLSVGGGFIEGDGSIIKRYFYNKDFYLKGRLKAEFELDPSGNLIRGRRVDLPAPPAASSTPGLTNSIRTGFYFPPSENTYSLFYEGAFDGTEATIDSELAAATPAAPKYRQEFRQYDARGNLTAYTDFGDPKLSTEVDYAVTYTPFDATTNITRATDIKATNGGTMFRHRAATYVPGRGVIQTLTNFVSGGKVPASGTPGSVYNQASSIYNFTYDAYGNLQTYSDPTGYQLKYTYDTQTQTYRSRTDDLTFGYFSKATYDPRFGVVTQQSDVNGQPESYAYDIFGRACSVRGPDDQPTTTLPTISMTYGIVPTSCPNGPAAGTTFPPYAVTRHKDVQRSTDPIDTVTFVDGLRRVIQTKKDIDVDQAGNGTVVTGMSVSGQVLFDSRGRIASQAQPAFSNAATSTFVASGNTSNVTLYGYDSIGRQTSVNVPDGTAQGIQTSTSYSVVAATDANSLGDGKPWLLTSVVDPDGNSRRSYADVRGNRVAVREYNTIGTASTLTTLTTKYVYDPMDQLLNVTDAKGNVTSAGYDTLGQMVTVASPDAGQTEYRFDLAGNMKEKQTPVLRSQSKVITYGYDHDRLISISYPNQANPPQVTYAYGLNTDTGDTKGNLASRIKKVTFEAGNETRTYDHLGNANKTVTTLNRMSTTTGLPAQIAFTMKYSYDWLGRMQNMTFPNWIDQSYNILAGEGELVTYTYDHGGNVDTITGKYQTANPQQTSVPTNFNYLSHVGYNQFEQRTAFVSGNGISNQYGYDQFDRRLTDVNASSLGAQEHQLNKPATPFHRIHYTYDKVGNITHMVNNVSVQPWRNASVFVGPLDVSYTYDNLYQLRSLTGKYRPNVAYGYQYSDTYTYNEIGAMLTKAQSQDRLVWDNQTVNTGDTNPVVSQLAGSRFDHNVTALTYSLGYQYTSGRPHAPAPVTETPAGSASSSHTYTYDANGNNTGGAFAGNTRVQNWDEESRLKEVDRNGGMVTKYLYDDQGERKKRQSSAGDAWYASQYFVLLPNNLPTKHIFAGETRIATKTDAIYMQTPALTYYHPDNVGSTSYTSAANQDLLQHERYFAFGELWRPGAEQEECDLGRPDNLRREWTFTSKEWGVDESLSYFGARYFDPHADVWQSPDPMLASYVQGQGNNGVFFPRNLGLYSYAANNPVVAKDPDGRIIWLLVAAGVAFGILKSSGTPSEPAGGGEMGTKPTPTGEFIGNVAVGTMLPLMFAGSGESPKGPGPWAPEPAPNVPAPRVGEGTVLAPDPVPTSPQVSTGGQPTTGPALPESYWTGRQAPTQVEPGTRTVTEMKPSSRSKGETYERTSHYDEYGRQTGQTHKTSHGEPSVHPDPHHHIRNPSTGQTSGPLPGVHPEY